MTAATGVNIGAITEPPPRTTLTTATQGVLQQRDLSDQTPPTFLVTQRLVSLLTEKSIHCYIPDRAEHEVHGESDLYLIHLYTLGNSFHCHSSFGNVCLDEGNQGRCSSSLPPSPSPHLSARVNPLELANALAACVLSARLTSRHRQWAAQQLVKALAAAGRESPNQPQTFSDLAGDLRKCPLKRLEGHYNKVSFLHPANNLTSDICP